MRIVHVAEGWTGRREAESAAHEYNLCAEPMEYAQVTEPRRSDPFYRIRIIEFQPADFVAE